MIAVLTGDIINSQLVSSEIWLTALKNVLTNYGKHPQHWETYRGDSFQLEVEMDKALQAAIHIKSRIKEIPNIDVRIAIGIGERTYKANRITESNGSAFINSGQCFDNLKKNTLAIKSPWHDFDEEFNLYLQLALLTMDSWPLVTALVFATALENPNLNQKELGKLLDRTQSMISETLSRAGHDEIKKLISRYNQQISLRI